MSKSQDKTIINSIEQKVAIQMVALSMIIIVVILTLISFIRIYSSKKHEILKIMRSETAQLQSVMTDHLNYSIYFTNLIAKNIQSNIHDLSAINHALKDQFITQREFNNLFGWKKYSWINHDFLELVTNTGGIRPTPQSTNFIKETLANTNINNTYGGNKITFYTHIDTNQKTFLKLINSVVGDNGKEYLGSVVLSYDINTVVQGLNKRKNNKSTNFVVLDKKLQVIAESNASISNLIGTNKKLDANLNNALKTLDSYADKNIQGIPYLDMISGVNYLVSPLKGFPFIIVINIDNNEIRQDILDSMTKKFIEVCVFALLSLLIIAALYKRETFLRAKAERATLVANNATRAQTNFLAFTAHEIRSPLGFILTGSEIMTKELMGKLPINYKEYAEGIHGNAQIILDFITDILDESQIIEGKFKIVNASNNIENIINEAMQTNLTSYAKRNIKILSKLGDNLPLLICDKRRIVQVMSNLISNSIKYSEDNTTIQIIVNVIREGLEIQIIDQGIGMSEEELPIALSIYGTINNRDYNSTSSYGLGLPIVTMLLNAHDAIIAIESTKGKGTTVTLTFPQYKLIYNDD